MNAIAALVGVVVVVIVEIVVECVVDEMVVDVVVVVVVIVPVGLYRTSLTPSCRWSPRPLRRTYLPAMTAYRPHVWCRRRYLKA